MGRRVVLADCKATRTAAEASLSAAFRFCRFFVRRNPCGLMKRWYTTTHMKLLFGEGSVRLLISASVLAAILSASSALPQDRAGDCREMVLYNGRVTTMDPRGTTASAIVIRDDRITLVSSTAGIPPHSSCAKVVDLAGRRVIPGLIDTHDHVSYSAARPGYEVHLD